jgi:Domain of unknown function (DUF4157)
MLPLPGVRAVGAEVQKARHEAARPAPAPAAAPRAAAGAPAAAVLSPQSLVGNSVLVRRAAAPAGGGAAPALLALQGAAGNRAVQRWAQGGSAPSWPARIHRAAQAGVTGPGERLPHYQAIQRSFGPAHDLSGVRAHVGGPAARANQAMHAAAFTAGEHVGFKAAPDLRLAAHEAAHVVQQRGGVSLSGGVGRAGDPYERHADMVAGRVVSGRPAHDLLAGSRAAGQPAVQRCGGVIHEGCACAMEAGGAADEASAAVQRNGDGGLLEEAGSALGGAVSTVTSAAGTVVSGVESAAGTVVSGVESAAGTVASVAGEVAGGVQSLYEQARNVAEDAWNKATGIARDAWDMVRAAGSWLYERGSAAVAWVGGKLVGLAKWLGSLAGITITPVGSGVRIGLPDIELLPREEGIPLPIQLPERSKTWPIGGIPVEIGGIPVVLELAAKATIAATSAANLGPVMVRDISLLLDPLASHYQGTGELDAPAEAAIQAVTTATLLGEATVIVPIGEIPVPIPTIGLEGGLRLTGQGTIGGDFRDRVTLDYAGGRITFSNISKLGVGLLLEADLDAIVGLTLLEKDICEWAWHLRRWSWGKAVQGTLDLGLAFGGGGGTRRWLTGRLDTIPVEDVISGVFDLHPEPNCPGMGAILDLLGIPKVIPKVPGGGGLGPGGGGGGVTPFGSDCGPVRTPSGSFVVSKPGHPLNGRTVKYEDIRGKHTRNAQCTAVYLESVAGKDPRRYSGRTQAWVKATNANDTTYGGQIGSEGIGRYGEFVRRTIEEGKEKNNKYYFDVGTKYGVDVEKPWPLTSKVRVDSAPHAAHIIPEA